MFRGTFLVYSERRGAKRAGAESLRGGPEAVQYRREARTMEVYGLAVKVKLTVFGSPLVLTSISWDCVPSDSCQAVMV